MVATDDEGHPGCNQAETGAPDEHERDGIKERLRLQLGQQPIARTQDEGGRRVEQISRSV